MTDVLSLGSLSNDLFGWVGRQILQLGGRGGLLDQLGEDGGGGLESHDGGTGRVACAAVGCAIVCVAKVSRTATNMDRSRAHQGIVS